MVNKIELASSGPPIYEWLLRKSCTAKAAPNGYPTYIQYIRTRH